MPMCETLGSRKGSTKPDDDAEDELAKLLVTGLAF